MMQSAVQKVRGFINRNWSLGLYAYVPILFLANHNFDMLMPEDILRPFVLVTIAVLVLATISELMIKAKDRAYIVSQLILLFIFTYGHYSIILSAPYYGFFTALTHWYYIIPYTIFFISLGFGAVTGLLDLKIYSKLVFQVFLIMFLFNFLVFISRVVILGNKLGSNKVSTNQFLSRERIEDNPDIYLIVLDGHGRKDVLKNLYSYDITPFESELKNMGFHINEKFINNYTQTYLSMASLFTMNYIDTSAQGLDIESDNRELLLDKLVNNDFVALLKDENYTFVLYETGWTGSTVLNKIKVPKSIKSSISETEISLLNTTFIPVFWGGQLSYRIHANRTNHVFDDLPRVAENNEATFTYAHIISPHPPFVFDSEGNILKEGHLFTYYDSELKQLDLVSKENYLKKYIDQMEYVHKRILSTVKDILKKSEKPPIIIIMSDHGPAAEYTYYDVSDLGVYERFSSFNAVYFPDHNYEEYEKIKSPVNLLRVVSNQYFERQMEYLDDSILFTSSWNEPYLFHNVTERYEVVLDTIGNQN